MIAFFGLLASIATALGIPFALYQLWLAKRQNVIEFEDSLNKEYRDLVKELPISIVLGGDITESELYSNLNIFYRYLDLTNEQIYLRINGRITKSTWKSWEEGIRINMSGLGFQKAWKHLLNLNNIRFNELQRLLSEPQHSDPWKWK